MLASVFEVSYRSLRCDDIDDVAAIVVRCDALTAEWGPEGWALPEGHLERERRIWHEDVVAGEFWCEVACDDTGTIVGAVAAKPGKAGKGPPSGHVASLFIEPALHGRGLGVGLLRRAEDWLRTEGCDRATLNVLEGSPAIEFYESQGWSRDGRRGHFDQFDIPTIGFAKRLN